MTEYLATADALFFHQQLIERYGGARGVRDVGALESAQHRPQTGYYDTLLHEAAALLESLVQNHPFVDGNKRIAFIATALFLRLNGYRLSSDPLDEIQTMLRLAAGELSEADFAVWIRNHTKSTK